MKPKILGTGGYPNMQHLVCKGKDNPRKRHHMQDISSKPNPRGGGEMLVTSRCKYCGALVIDCPTIGIFFNTGGVFQ